MNKIGKFQITGMTISGFKSYEKSTELVFGNPTVITGGNGRGKTSIADAVAFAVTGLPFFGERGLDRLHNESNPDVFVQMRFLDENDIPHELTRTRQKDRMTIHYDGREVRQMDLTDLFGEKDVFLAIFNPLYFIEELGNAGKNLLEMYLPRVSQAEVLAQLSEPVRRHLEKEDILSPEAYLKARREKIRSLEERITYVTGQRDQAAAQKQRNVERSQSFPQRYDTLQKELAGLKEKQFSGMDVAAMNEQLMELSGRYSEARRDGQTDGSELRGQLTTLREKIAARRAEQYQSKYTQPLADAQARVQALSAQYSRDAAAYRTLVPGAPCPICRRPVTEEELPKIQEELRSSAAALLAQGQEQQAQIKELQELDRKARETFEQFQADDLKKWETEAQQLEDKLRQLADDDAAQAENLRMEIQHLSADLEYGKLTQEEYDRLQACQEECRQCEVEMTALQSVEDADAADFDKQIKGLKAEITEQKKLIADATVYASKRAEMIFSVLKMNRVEISLFDVVKSTGEWKDAFKFIYNGRRYDRLSLSEKVRAGMEVSELVKRLTGRNYPVFVDNMDFFNTIFLNILFIVTGTICSVFLALVFVEIKNKVYNKVVQTIAIFPHFVSWTVVAMFLGGIIGSSGTLTQWIIQRGGENPNFYNDAAWWPLILVLLKIWQGAGYGTIVYVAAITGFDQGMYEAARIDGATRLQMITRITLPLLKPTIIMLTIMSVGKIFAGDFGMIYALVGENSQLFPTTDVIDTFVYRALRQLNNMGMSTATSLFQSVVGLIMVIGSNALAKRIEPDSAIF